MSRARGTLLAGVVAGLLSNYWLAETVLADRSEPAESWISDLGSRSESTALVFDVLDAASGVSILVLAGLLHGPLAGRSRRMRLGVIALGAVGVCTVIDGAFPLSCAESLDPACELRYDAVDIIHGTESFVAIGVSIAAFWLLGRGLRDEVDLRAAGTATLTLGAVWLLLNVLMGGKYLIDDLDSVKGIFQRASQVVFGAWLVLLGASVSRTLARAPRPTRP